MTFPKARLIVSACLFLGWLGFLLYLILDSSTVILSRPQFLLAQLYVVAEASISAPDGRLDPDVTVVEVLWSANDAERGLAGQSVHLAELSTLPKQHRFGAGKYLLPLQKTVHGKYEIAPIPRHANYTPAPPTHGAIEAFGLFSHHRARRVPIESAKQLHKEWTEAGYRVFLTSEEIRIYPWTAPIRAQVEELLAAKR